MRASKMKLESVKHDSWLPHDMIDAIIKPGMQPAKCVNTQMTYAVSFYSVSRVAVRMKSAPDRRVSASQRLSQCGVAEGGREDLVAVGLPHHHHNAPNLGSRPLATGMRRSSWPRCSAAQLTRLQNCPAVT